MKQKPSKPPTFELGSVCNRMTMLIEFGLCLAIEEEANRHWHQYAESTSVSGQRKAAKFNDAANFARERASTLRADIMADPIIRHFADMAEGFVRADAKADFVDLRWFKREEHK